jgi:hypothetical protein
MTLWTRQSGEYLNNKTDINKLVMGGLHRMQHSLVRKGLVVGIIGILVMVAVAPSINAYNINGRKPTIYDSYKSMLSTVDSVEETITTFKEIIIDLDKNGLLPNGLDAGSAYNVFLKGFDGDKHYLVCGYTNNSLFNTIPHLLLVYGSFLTGILSIPLFRKIITNLSPIDIRANVAFGYTVFDYMRADEKIPAYGWINIIGIDGKQQCDGTFYGQHLDPYIQDFINPTIRNHCGITKFTGLRIGTFYGSNHQEGKSFFIGYASDVAIGYDYPLGE